MSLPRLDQWTRPRDAVTQLRRGSTLRTCSPDAVVAGTVLSVVNQGHAMPTWMSNKRVVVKLGTRQEAALSDGIGS